MADYLIDNNIGIVQKERSVLEILESIIKQSISSDKQISLYIVSNFNFFDCFKRLSNLFKILIEKKLLIGLKIIFVSKNKLSVRDAYREFKKDAISLDEVSYKLLENLYLNKQFESYVFIEKTVDTNFFIVKSSSNCEIFVGSASFSSIKQSEKIEFIAKIDSSNEHNIFLNLFDYLLENSTTTLYDKLLIDILKKCSESEALFINHKDFIATTIKVLEKEFLSKNLGTDLSFYSEIQYMSYYYCLSLLKNYGIAFLYNCVGLGKTEVSSLIIKYYIENDKTILIIHNSFDLIKWQDSLKRANVNKNSVEYISKEELCGQKIELKKENSYDLIIVSESEIFRNSEIHNQINLNLNKIIKTNEEADFLLMSDFFTYSSLLDFSNLIKIFAKVKNHPKLIVNNILKIIDKLEKSIEMYSINEETIGDLFFLINSLSVNIKSTDFATYINTNLTVNYEKPTITQVKYAYTHEIYVKIYDRLAIFLKDLNLEYIKLWNDIITDVDLNYYRFRICKKLESSIYSFRVCLKNILEKNILTNKIIMDNRVDDYPILTKIQQENILKNFNKLDESKRNDILTNINKDIKNIENYIAGIEQIKYLENLDDKITSLLKILKTENRPTIIFSESKDTVLYIERRLGDYGGFKTIVCYGNEQTLEEGCSHDNINLDRDKIVNEFNSGEKNILITTDIFDENFIFSRAETIINFDLSYNPSILYQRANKIDKNTAPKKTKIYNFQPDRRIDKESQLFETLQLKNRDLFAIIGLDFLYWLMKDKKENLSNDNIQNLYYLSKDYKDILATRNPEDIQIKFHISEIEDNLILREYIKFFNISEDTLKLTTFIYNKTIFTTFRSKRDGYFVFYNYNGEVYSLNNIIHSEESFERELSKDDLSNIKENVINEIKLINEKLKINTTIISDDIHMGIIRYFKN